MGDAKLKKNLKLFDVFAISTGAMFSSGFFLLPGIAAAQTGPSAYLAYLVAGFLIIPAMFCMAELSTAMPKAGGTYYFLDRSLGPMVGTIGGLGSWIAVIFKSAFALVGMGAYLSLYIDVPITALAVVLTLVFGLVNVFGAKETTMLQRILVGTLVSILALFIVLGLMHVGFPDALSARQNYDTFFRDDFVGFAAVVGLVFVSYAGLTKVASVAEEVENPDRNIPLGMILSLITATTVYTLGMMVMINVLNPDDLYGSLTPVADAGEQFLSWIPYDIGILLIVVAAISAFASTGNAGIMSASRYPFAMAKDRLVPEQFGKLGKFETPVKSIAATVGVMVLVLVLFDVESVAKLASAFQLLLFGMVCMAVIVMRESRIESYKPGFNTPLYPWLPVLGILISFWLIVQMGVLAIGFTGMVVMACVLWYFFYGVDRVRRGGAWLHVHERLELKPDESLEDELMGIVEERTSAENISYELLIARSLVFDSSEGVHHFEEVKAVITEALHERTCLPDAELEQAFADNLGRKHLLGSKVALWYRDFPELDESILLIFRYRESASIELPDNQEIKALIFLFTPAEPAGLDLRLAGQLASIMEGEAFASEWVSTEEHSALRDLLMRDGHFMHANVEELATEHKLVGSSISEIELPESCQIALIVRDGQLVSPSPDETLQSGDTLTLVGEKRALKKLTEAKAPR